MDLVNFGKNLFNRMTSNCSFLNAAGKEVFSSTASVNQLSSNNSLSPCAPPSKDAMDIGAPLSPSTLAKLRGPRDETVKDDSEMHDDDTKDVDLGAPLSPSTLSKIRRQGNDNDDDEAEKKQTEPKHEDKVSISSDRKFDEESNEVSNQDEEINPTHSYTSEQGNEESVTEQEQSFQLEILSKQPKTSRDIETETSRDIETETSRDIETETSRDTETETSRDIETEKSRDIETETPRDIETDCQVESSNVLATEEEMTDPKTLDSNETGENASTEYTDGDVIEMKDDVTVSERNDVILENDRTIESSDNETMNKSTEEEITESAMNEVEIIDSKSEGTMIDDVIDHSKNDVNTVELCETIEMEIPTIADVMTESKDGVIVDSVTDKNNDIIINSEANDINLENSPKMTYWSRKQPGKKPCPFCGKMVRNVRPSLNSEFLKTSIRMRGKIRLQSRDKGQLKAHIYDVKHELIHSEGLAMTRKLIHILRCLKLTLKKLEKP
ncbi:protein starmaker-like isoform X1 [Clytia hemisphaerica]|uniref:protein starmaker-like isoform X1 n=1 Tax=Clytia hemisphaerica TaxID=252671 RepID=UPI0034D424BE